MEEQMRYREEEQRRHDEMMRRDEEMRQRQMERIRGSSGGGGGHFGSPGMSSGNGERPKPEADDAEAPREKVRRNSQTRSMNMDEIDGSYIYFIPRMLIADCF